MSSRKVYPSSKAKEAVSFQYSKTNSTISIADVLKPISDDKSLSIFRTIADVNFNGEISPKKLGLSRKQYYSRISITMETGLIKRKWKILSHSFW